MTAPLLYFEWDGKTYEFDRGIDTPTAIGIKDFCGLTYFQWLQGIDAGDVHALTSLLWAMKRQNGERVNIRALNFNQLEFIEAVRPVFQQDLIDRARKSAEEAAGAAGMDDADPTVTAPESAEPSKRTPD